MANTIRNKSHDDFANPLFVYEEPDISRKTPKKKKKFGSSKKRNHSSVLYQIEDYLNESEEW